MFRKVLPIVLLAIGSLMVAPAVADAAPESPAKVYDHHSSGEAFLTCSYIAYSEYGGLVEVRNLHWDFLWSKWYVHCRYINNWTGGCFEILVEEISGALIDLGGVSCTAPFP